MNQMTDTELLDALQDNACGTKQWLLDTGYYGVRGWSLYESCSSRAVSDVRQAIREGLQRHGIGGEPMKSIKDTDSR